MGLQSSRVKALALVYITPAHLLGGGLCLSDLNLLSGTVSAKCD